MVVNNISHNLQESYKTRRQHSSLSSHCALCSQVHIRLTSPTEWVSEEARAYASSLQLPMGSLVCRTCRRDISIAIADPAYIPRWKREKRYATHLCSVLECSTKSFASLTLSTREETEQACDTLGLKYSTPLPSPTPFCKRHYHQVYEVVQEIPRRCITCGTWLKYASTRKRCPNPDMVEQYLRENAGFEDHIKPSSHVCLTCYRAQQVILNHHKQTSRDEDLLAIIEELEKGNAGPVTAVEAALLTHREITSDVPGSYGCGC